MEISETIWQLVPEYSNQGGTDEISGDKINRAEPLKAKFGEA
jgi:hypothetical protein